MTLLHITNLHGRSIIKWIATEMALSDRPGANDAVLWSDLSVPYLQLTSIDIQFDEGSAYRMLSQLGDDSEDGFFGLYLLAQEAMDRLSDVDADAGSIYRTRELTELPLGEANVTGTRADGPNAIVRVDVLIDGRIVSFRAAEVYERSDGSFDIVGPDECILVQVDGAMPVKKTTHQKTSVHATACDELRPAPALPAHLLATVTLIGRAYPHAIPETEYAAVLRILYDHMSDRNLADVISYVTGKDIALTYNDVLGVPSSAVGRELLQAVNDKLVRAGLQAWIDAG